MYEFVKIMVPRLSLTSIIIYTISVITIFYLLYKLLTNNNNAPKKIPLNNRNYDIYLIPGPPEPSKFKQFLRSLNPNCFSKVFYWHLDMHKTYGPIAVERQSNVPVVVHLFNRQDIEKIIRYPSKYPYRPATEIVAFYRNRNPERYASTGLVNEQGESWHHLRSRLTPYIQSPKNLQKFIPTLNSICDDFVDVLKHKRNTNGVVENFQKWANLMGLEATCALMLGRRIGVLSTNPNPKYLLLADAVKQLFAVQRDSTFGLKYWKSLPRFDLTYRKFRYCEEIIFNTISDIIKDVLKEEKLKIPSNKEHSVDVDNTVDNSVFVSILEDPTLDEREKQSAIVDFIAAGIETFANTLSFVLYYITRESQTQEKIYEEFPEYNDKEILQEHIKNAVYTKACIQECYRISPTASCLARITEEDTILSGYLIKKGTAIVCHTLIAARNEENFINADVYTPERWLKSNDFCDRFNSNNSVINTEANQQRTQRQEPGTSIVIPFGVGKRMCPGRRFVDIELHIILAKLVRAFKIDFIGKLEYEFEFLLVPKPPVNITFVDRV